MKEYKASTKRGEQIISMGLRCDGYSLSDLYNSWSQEKQEAYERCLKEFESDKKSSVFRIGNANSFCFTASWLTFIEGEIAMRVETKDNSYLVWLGR